MRLSDISIAGFHLLLLLCPVVARDSITRKTCTVKANGNKQDDVPNILEAFQNCGNGGKIVFPENESYWIATKLNPILENVEIEWRGEWTVCSLFSTLNSALVDLLISSFRTISITGETILTLSPSKTTQLDSSFLVMGSRSMDMKLGVLMAMVMHGILMKPAILNLVDPCHLCSGMYLK